MASDLLSSLEGTGRGGDVPPLTLITLGGARLVSPALTTSERGLLEVGKPLALIAFVCACPGRQARRDLLLDLLWADLEPDAAKHALRQTLWYIKKRVGEGIITATSDIVTVSDVIDVDRDALLAASDGSDHARVVGLYAGEYLPNFATPGGAEFEKWAEIERRRLRLIFLRSAEARVHELLGKGRPRDALGIARQARDADSLAQAGWRLVLEVLTAARDWPNARLEADAFEGLLAREELEFEPASRALLRVARGGEQIEITGEHPPPSPSAELVGREREFALLLEGVEAAQRGRGRHIHLRASAGIGKSRLLLDLHARLRGARTRTALVRCDMGAREIPYAAASEIALALGVLPGARGISPESASALVAMAPSLSTWFAVPNDLSSGQEALRRRTLALSELVSAVSDEQALVLIVDDVHWMDASSRIILGQLASRVSQQRTLVVTAGRPSAEGRVDAGMAQIIELHPLTEAQCAELVASIAATGANSLPRRFIPELWRATLGSPLHVLEMLQLLRERNLLWIDDGEWRTSSGEQLLQVLRDGGALQRRFESLPREERAMLVLLAVAGVPSSMQMLAAASGGGEERTGEWLRNLEQRGLVSRSNDVWELAHDEIGEAAFEHTSAENVRAAHAALGRWLWHESANDARSMRLAAQHLAQGGETAPLHALFHRFVRLLRSLGDSRPLLTLADDMLGRHASAELARGLVRSLPLHVRVGLTSSRRLAAVSVAAIVIPLFAILAFLAWTNDAPRTPDAELEAYITDSLGSTRRVSVPIVGDRLASGGDVSIDVRKGSSWHVDIGRMPVAPAEAMDGRGVAVSLAVADSGTNDLFYLTPNGKKERLTFARGDDQGPAWSPNDEYIAFETARWRDDSHYDLALLERRTSTVRPLTSGPASDASPIFSPRGHRLAFLRRYWDGAPTALCTVGFDGSDSSCVAPKGAKLAGLLAWSDDATALAVLDVDGAGAIAYLRIADGRFDIIERFASPSMFARGSSDGRWVVCHCRRIGYDPDSWFLIPTDRPALLRAINVEGMSAGESITFALAPRDQRRLIDSVTILTSPAPVLAGVPHRLTLVAQSALEKQLRIGPVHWSIVDTSMGSIDRATGVFVARRPGRVRVNASLAGWRTASALLDVQRSDTARVLDESWLHGIGRAWVSFGTPAPTTKVEENKGYLLNNGDGSYVSGVFTREAVPSNEGVLVETSFSTPITLLQWQYISVAMQPEFRVPPTAEEINRGTVTPSDGASCSINYPGDAEGKGYGSSLRASGRIEGANVAATAEMRNGTPQQIALGVLPDGRCFALLNDSLVWTASEPMNFEGRVHVLLSGSSTQTSVRFGAAHIMRGIPQRIIDKLSSSAFDTRASVAAPH